MAVLIGIAIGRQFGGTGTPKFQEPDPTAVEVTDSNPRSENLAAEFDQSLDVSGAAQISDVFTVVQRAQTAGDCLRFANQLLANGSNATSESLWAVLFARWSEIAPRSMVAFVDGLASSNMRSSLEQTVFFAWGAVDPNACFEVVRTRAPHLQRSALNGMTDLNIEKAAEIALKLPDGQSALGSVAARGRLPEHLVKKYLARSIYDSSRMPLLNSLTSRLAESDPAAAIEQAKRNGRIWNDQVASVISQVARNDPSAAIAELKKLPESRSRAISAVELAKTWASDDSEAALTWVRNELRPNVRKSAILEIASTIGGRDPAAGLALFEEIGWQHVGDFYEIETVSNGKTSNSRRYGYASPEIIASALLRQLNAADPETAHAFILTTPPRIQNRLLEMTDIGGTQE